MRHTKHDAETPPTRAPRVGVHAQLGSAACLPPALDAAGVAGAATSIPTTGRHQAHLFALLQVVVLPAHPPHVAPDSSQARVWTRARKACGASFISTASAGSEEHFGGHGGHSSHGHGVNHDDNNIKRDGDERDKPADDGSSSSLVGDHHSKHDESHDDNDKHDDLNEHDNLNARKKRCGDGPYGEAAAAFKVAPVNTISDNNNNKTTQDQLTAGAGTGAAVQGDGAIRSEASASCEQQQADERAETARAGTTTMAAVKVVKEVMIINSSNTIISISLLDVLQQQQQQQAGVKKAAALPPPTISDRRTAAEARENDRRGEVRGSGRGDAAGTTGIRRAVRSSCSRRRALQQWQQRRRRRGRQQQRKSKTKTTTRKKNKQQLVLWVLLMGVSVAMGWMGRVAEAAFAPRSRAELGGPSSGEGGVFGCVGACGASLTTYGGVTYCPYYRRPLGVRHRRLRECGH